MRLIHLFRRAVPVALQGKNWLALPLRLGDLADIEVISMASWVPTEVPRGDISDPAYRQALREACEAGEAELPEWGSEACNQFAFATVGGRAMTLKAVLREHELDDGATLELANALTSEEWNVLDRIAWGIDPATEAYRLVDTLIGVPPYQPGAGISWAQAICEVATSLGCAPADLAEMTVPEFSLLRRNGKRTDPWGDWSDEDGEGWAYYTSEVAPRREAFWNEGRDEGAAERN